MPEGRLAVSTAGTRELHSARPPWQLVKELVQNAWDEVPNATVCNVSVRPRGSRTVVSVEDDGAGFRNIEDALDCDSVQGFYEELREAAKNIEDAFNAAVPQSDVLNEAADVIEEWYERLAEVKGDAEMAVTEGSTDPDIFRELLERANEAIGEVPDDVEFSA